MSVDFSDERISAYLDGELPLAQRAEIEALLASSPEHRQLVDELRALRATLQDLPRPPLAGDFTERVMQRAIQAASTAPRETLESSSGDGRAMPSEGGGTSVSDLAARHSFELRRWRRAFWSVASVAAGLFGMLVVTNLKQYAGVAMNQPSDATAFTSEVATSDGAALGQVADERMLAMPAPQSEAESLAMQFDADNAPAPVAPGGNTSDLNALYERAGDATGLKRNSAALPPLRSAETRESQSAPANAPRDNLGELAKEIRPAMRRGLQEKAKDRQAGSGPGANSRNPTPAAKSASAPSPGGLGGGGGFGSGVPGEALRMRGGSGDPKAALGATPPARALNTPGLPGPPPGGPAQTFRYEANPDMPPPNAAGGAVRKEVVADKKQLRDTDGTPLADKARSDALNRNGTYVLMVTLPDSNGGEDVVQKSLSNNSISHDFSRLAEDKSANLAVKSKVENQILSIQATRAQAQGLVDELQAKVDNTTLFELPSAPLQAQARRANLMLENRFLPTQGNLADAPDPKSGIVAKPADAKEELSRAKKDRFADPGEAAGKKKAQVEEQQDLIDIILVVDVRRGAKDAPAPMPPLAEPAAKKPDQEPKLEPKQKQDESD